MQRIQVASGAVVLGVLWLSGAPAAAQTLESPVLRLEVAAQPYGFRVIEKSTGDVLLAHTRTVLASGNAVQALTSGRWAPA